jgi:hypothetical protein
VRVMRTRAAGRLAGDLGPLRWRGRRERRKNTDVWDRPGRERKEERRGRAREREAGTNRRARGGSEREKRECVG